MNDVTSRFCFLIFLFFFVGCSPANLKDLRCEGEAEMKKLTAELKKIESKEDVQKASKKLKKRFNRIADLLIETRKFSSPNDESIEPVPAGEELFAELARIYEIPGARAAIETAQSEAVHRLDRSKTASKRF